MDSLYKGPFYFIKMNNKNKKITIAPEGKIILLPLSIILIIGVLFNYIQSDPIVYISYFNLFNLFFLVFSLYFFRNPYRLANGLSNQMVSPADGKIIDIRDVEDIDIKNAKKISIFLSVFNVHSQYVPIDSNVISSNYFRGKYFLAFNHKASLNNERTTTLFETKQNNKFKINQIAGCIARRILNYMKPDQNVNKGQRLGFIRFGSRVEIIISKDDFLISVKEGDTLKGNLSIIGQFK